MTHARTNEHAPLKTSTTNIYTLLKAFKITTNPILNIFDQPVTSKPRHLVPTAMLSNKLIY